MFINELLDGSALTVTAFSDDKKAVLESTVSALSETDRQFLTDMIAGSGFRSGIAADLFESDGQIINFSSDIVQCDCIGIHENLPHQWEKVTIAKHEFPDAGNLHVIFSSHDAHSFNRRKDFRQWLGMECTLTYGSPALSIRGTIKDISVTGMGLLVKPDCEIARGTRVKVQFAEMKTNSEGETVPIPYTVITQAVRSASVNDHTKLIGCRITEGSKDYVNFLYKKQRESMQREKGTDL